MVRIGINAHLLSGQAGYRRAGIHHYVAQTLAHLPVKEDWHYTIFSQDQESLIPGPDRLIISSRLPTARPPVRIGWEQFVWPVAAVRKELDLLHGMAFVTPVLSRCPAVVTVYDLSFIHFPDRYSAGRRLYLTNMTRFTCRRARRIITISESTRQDIQQFFGVPAERIDLVYPGVGERFRPLPAVETTAFRTRNALSDPFILHVGTLQPRKNLPLLIDAFALLLAEYPERWPTLQLVLVGGKGWDYDEIFARVTTHHLHDRVRFAGYVADEELVHWYNAAALLAFPSVYEGFGLPVVQAMACGTPVVAANTSAIPEVAGEAALLFDPQDVTALAERMATVLGDSALAAKMGAAGQSRAQKFSWVQAGLKTWRSYQKALE